MAGIPIVRFRITRASDGEGGFVDSYGAPYEMFGSIIIHKNKTQLIVDRCEDIRVGDVIAVMDEMDGDPAFYAVIGAEQIARGLSRTFELLRRDRPIWPLVSTLLVLNGEYILLNGNYLTVA